MEEEKHVPDLQLCDEERVIDWCSLLKLKRRTAPILSWKFAAFFREAFKTGKKFEASDFATFYGKREDERNKSEEDFPRFQNFHVLLQKEKD